MVSPAGILGDQRLPACAVLCWVLHLAAAGPIHSHTCARTGTHTLSHLSPSHLELTPCVYYCKRHISKKLKSALFLWLREMRHWLWLKGIRGLLNTNRPNLNQHPSATTPTPPPPSCLPSFLPFHRKKHVSTLLNIRGMMRQAERQEILNVVKDFECSNILMCRDHALFSDIPITSEVHCISLGILRLAMSITNWFSEHRPRRHRRSMKNTNPQPAESQTTEDMNKIHREN